MIEIISGQTEVSEVIEISDQTEDASSKKRGRKAVNLNYFDVREEIGFSIGGVRREGL